MRRPRRPALTIAVAVSGDRFIPIGPAIPLILLVPIHYFHFSVHRSFIAPDGRADAGVEGICPIRFSWLDVTKRRLSQALSVPGLIPGTRFGCVLCGSLQRRLLRCVTCALLLLCVLSLGYYVSAPIGRRH